MNIAVLLQQISHNQDTYNCIKSINSIVKDNYKDDYIIFYEDILKESIKPMCGCMNVCDLWSYQGTIIFTKLNQYITLSKMVLPKKTIFYLQDLEWLENFNYEQNYDIYTSVDFLVCRSQYHANALEKYCGRKADLIEPNFNIENILCNFQT